MTMADKPTGSETLVLLRFGESEIVAPFHERHDFKPGNTLNLHARAALAHLFDASPSASGPDVTGMRSTKVRCCVRTD